MQSQTLRGTLLPIALIIVAGCRAEDPVPRLLKERLEAVLDLGRKEPTPDELRDALLRQLRGTSLPQEGHAPSGTAPFPSRETINDFYTTHGHRLIWSDGAGKIVPVTTTLHEALRHAGDHGLVPEDYAVSRLEALEKEIRKGGSDERAATRAADFDLLATTAFFRYATDVSTGRVHPDEVESDWHTKPLELDLVKALDEALTLNDLAKLLEALPPPHPGYARLRQSLAKLREIEAAGGWPTVPPGPKLGLGSRGSRVALLRQRLSEGSSGHANRAPATAPSRS